MYYHFVTYCNSNYASNCNHINILCLYRHDDLLVSIFFIYFIVLYQQIFLLLAH